jgi:tape measure domain-containing protein
MASVDDRIVRMEFDNAAFERKIATTLTSLGQLEKALKFEGASKGLADVTSAADKVSFHGIAEGIEGLSKKFIALSTIAITALANITSKAVEAGLHIAKSLSLDQVIAGFKEYELNIGSIQTILANTKAEGTTLDQVNAALDQLNQYSDKTIYNFGQMAKNIGTFTAAGVDLNTSVMAIKGISNLAAISGSSADQASVAMYQLSQAISTGTVKLIDWNSVVNAGMGGEVFQKALFETGKTLGTIKDVPIGQTFEDWTSAGNSFRGSLESGWLTAEVLTTTLQGFTGDMTDAELAAKGFTAEQIAQIQKLGKTGVDAATKVRTFTGLLSTLKESIGSGWSATFRILIGNFTEATDLFTGISDTLGGMIQKSADARNELLQGWKDLGGRTVLLESIKTAIQNLGEILKPIKDAFREIFPPTTAQTLMNLTNSFKDFANALKPSQKTVENLHRIFKGFFSILGIGWEIVKQGAKFIGELLGSITGAGAGPFLDFVAKIGDFFTELYGALVKGEGIKDFFAKLTEVVKSPLPFLSELKDKIVDFFTGFDPNIGDKVSDSLGRLGDRFASLKGLADKVKDIWEPFSKAMKKVGEILDKAWDAIHDWFSELGKKIADTMGEGSFDQALDALNTALFGGIVALVAKFVHSGFKIDFGGGFLEGIKDTLGELTGVLKAMQTDIKANALLKIAGAIALLTASVLVLSLIDSAALTKALAAMAVGFGQLMATFAVVSKMNTGPMSAISFTMLAGGLTVLAGAILILSIAAKSLAELNWEELARGLVGVTVLLGIMVLAVIPLSKMQGSLISTGIGLIAIAVALNILAGAVKIFSLMSWGDMASGLAGVAIGLALLGVGMRAMPSGMALQGVGLIAVAVALNILGLAVKSFADLSWGEMAKGMVGIAGGLLIIAGAMQLMPPTMPVIGVGLLLVSVSLIAIAKAMQMMGGLSWGEIGKGLATMAASLLILAVATTAMTGSIAGAIAIGIVSASLLLLAKVLQAFASISFGDLLHGLAGVAIALAALGVAALLLQPAIPAMIALGAALILIGAGFALFGAGAMLVGKAFEMVAKSGAAGSKAFVEALKNMGRAIPAFVTGLAEGIVLLIEMIGAAAPTIAEAIGKLLAALLDQIKKLIPKLGTIIRLVMEEIFKTIQFYIPRLVETGLLIITSLLTGIRDHIPEIVTLVGEIITGFLDAFATQLAAIVDSVVNLWVTMITSVAEALGEVSATLFFGVAAAFIKGFMNGLEAAIPGPMNWFMDLANKVLKWIGNVISTLWNKGVDFITGLMSGVTSKVSDIASFFGSIAGKVLGWIGDTVGTLVSKGYGLISGFFSGISDRWTGVVNFFRGIGDKVLSAIGDLSDSLYNAGKAVIQGLWDGMQAVWHKATGWLNSLNPLNHFNDINMAKGHAIKNLVPAGKAVMQGLYNGMYDEWGNITGWLSELDPASELDRSMGDRMATVINGALTDMMSQLSTMDEFYPVITPILDLSVVAQDAKEISSLIEPAYSYAQASTIASTTTTPPDETMATPAVPGQVSFEQNIYAPKQLSTGDIYKQTRNQITMAKEELSIP